MRHPASHGLIGVILALASNAPAHAQRVVYADALGSGFENWSHGGGSDFANPAPVHGGSLSIALSGNAWNALSFRHTGALRT